MKKIILAAMGLALIATSCKKYPDGPSFTLESKTARISGNWRIEQVLVNGYDVTNEYNLWYGSSYELDITKSGSYTIQGNFGDHGNWSFTDGKADVSFISQAGKGTTSYKILRLESESMWYQDADSSNLTREIHYKH
jgi:hypothetical protein